MRVVESPLGLSSFFVCGLLFYSGFKVVSGALKLYIRRCREELRRPIGAGVATPDELTGGRVSLQEMITDRDAPRLFDWLAILVASSAAL